MPLFTKSNKPVKYKPPNNDSKEIIYNNTKVEKQNEIDEIIVVEEFTNDIMKVYKEIIKIDKLVTIVEKYY